MGKPLKLPGNLAKHCSINGLARRVATETGAPFETTHKRLRRVLFHWLAQDVARGLKPWMFRLAESKAWNVDVFGLRRAHPEFFADASPKELEDRVEELEWKVIDLAKEIARINARLGPEPKAVAAGR